MGWAGCGPASQTFNTTAPKDGGKRECPRGLDTAWDGPQQARSCVESSSHFTEPCKSRKPTVTLPRSSEFYKNVLTYAPPKKTDEWMMLRDPSPSCSSPPIPLGLPPGGGGRAPPRSTASASLRCSRVSSLMTFSANLEGRS